MSDIAIKVENLHKLYRLGIKDETKDTLAATLVSWLKAPQKNFKQLRSLGQFDLDSNDPDVLHALNDVSFEVKHGEVLGIIGRNGAGKSTLLKVLSRITEPTAGRVTINGRVASLLEVGTGFHPELSGRENIYMNGTILGMTKKEIDRKFDEIVDFSGVEKFLDTPIKRYSSGMKVRLAFSVAAHLEPEILIIDEVLAVGDAEFQRKCLGKMEEVSKGGRTVLFVSHNMDAVSQLCTVCLQLEAGQVSDWDFNVNSIVQKYLNKCFTGDQETMWVAGEDAPAFNSFSPKKFSILDKNGAILNPPARVDDGVFVSCEFFVEEIEPALTVGYAIYSDSGQLIFMSFHTDGPRNIWPNIKQGYNSLKAWLPGRLLNAGRYRIELLAALYQRGWLIKPGSMRIMLQLDLSGGISHSPYWTDVRQGLLAPEIDWS